MLVVRSALSGIAVRKSGHPLRTRCVLADPAGTARAVFLWPSGTSGPPDGGVPCWSAGICCESRRSAGFPAVCLIVLPSQPGMLFAAAGGVSPLFDMAGEPFMQGGHPAMQDCRPARYLKEVSPLVARTVQRAAASRKPSC